MDALSNEELIGVIYLARNRVNGKTYIGLSKNGLKYRRERHINAAMSGADGLFYRAIRKYGVGTFSWSVIKRGPISELPRLEISTIDQYKKAGYILYNLTDGGDGGLNPSSESIEKMSIAQKKLWANPKYKEKMVTIRNSPEGRKKNSDSKKAVWDSTEGREKYISTITEAMNRPEVKEKLSISGKTAWKRLEVYEKMCIINKEVQNRPEVKAKKSASGKKAKNLPEAIAKNREIQLALWKRPEYRDMQMAARQAAKNRREAELLLKIKEQQKS